MGKKKINFEMIIIGAIIAGTLLYLVFRRTDRMHYEIPEMNNLDNRSITKIVMTKADRTVILKRDNNEWKVGEEGHKADADRAGKIEKAVSGLKLTTLVSTAGNYFNYELDNERRINVKVYQGDNLIREFNAGKPASTYDHTHVTIRDDNNVYHAEGSLRTDLDRSVDDLRDKAVFSFDTRDISRIEFDYQGKKYTLVRSVKPRKENSVEKKDGKVPEEQEEFIWNYGTEPADTGKVNSLMTNFNSQKCDSYKYKDDMSDIGGTLFKITFIGTAEHALSFTEIRNDSEERYLGSSSQSEHEFFIRKYRIDNVLDDLKEIFGLKQPSTAERQRSASRK